MLSNSARGPAELSELALQPLQPLQPLAAPALVRPANLRRSLFHLLSGVVALGLIRLLPSREWLIAASAAFVVMAWTMELSRRQSPAINRALMRLFAPVAHPHEHHQVNSATWYVTGLLLLASFAPLHAAELGVVVLAVADPAAGFVGRRWGRTRLRARRSLEGALAFVLVGGLAALAWLSMSSTLAPGAMVLLALGAAAIGAVTELASTRADDNFTIPVAVAFGIALIGHL